MPKRAIVGKSPTRKGAAKAKPATGKREASSTNGHRTTRAAASATRRTKSSPNAVTIRAAGGLMMTIPLDDALKRFAVDWSRIVRNRARWATQADTRDDQAQHSRETLQKLGLNLGEVDKLADEHLVQVSVPFVDEATGWEARIFPWEYVLGAALREFRTEPVVVVRHLEVIGADDGKNGKDLPQDELGSPQKVLILESVPDALQGRYLFESERNLVASALKVLEVGLLPNASPVQAKDHIKTVSPDAIHLAGFDSHQAATLLGTRDTGRDGYVMADQRGRPEAVSAEELARILTAGKRPLQLAAFNFQNSGARLAAMAVASGAEAAIGFQDRVDDAIAETFFASFYTAWIEESWNAPLAFQRSFLGLYATQQTLSGTGIVLWSARDALSKPAAAAHGEAAAARGGRRRMAMRPTPPTTGVPPPPPVTTAGALPEARTTQAPLTTQAAPQSATPGVASVIASTPDVLVVVRAIPRANYSLLQNAGALFDIFVIHNNTGQPVTRVEVEVVLYAGGDSFPYRLSLTLNPGPNDLKKDVRVPLTSSLLRGVRESLQSVVYVSVERDGQNLFKNTYPVALVPIEEWSHAPADEMWLPSFVLPRDRAVEEIVTMSRALLQGLRDDPAASFDGYQRVDQGRDDPYDVVDEQVRALWGTLSFHYNLGYIPPPPTYSSRAQRLRSPSSILAARAGTCIDLALLFASCLEYVEIYSVIVLYEGHASVGYWRGADLYKAFRVVRVPTDAADGPPTDAGADGVDGADDGAAAMGPDAAELVGSAAPGGAWLLRRQLEDRDPLLHELRRRVPHELSLLEATYIPEHKGFVDAQLMGEEGLRRKTFKSLIDIELARKSGVTPLPIEQR